MGKVFMFVGNAIVGMRSGSHLTSGSRWGPRRSACLIKCTEPCMSELLLHRTDVIFQ